MLEETIHAAGQVQAASEGEAAETRGEAADGLIQAVAGPDGRLTSLRLDPRAMRIASDQLAAHITAAVNAALDAQRARAGLPATGVDLSRLREQLREVQDTAVARMGSFIEAMTAAQDRIAAQARR